MSISLMPLWGVFTGVIIGVMISIEAGYLMGHAARRKSEDEKESPVSAMVGSVLALAAFMLCFTFGIVTNRFDARKELVRTEANVIRTAYLRADFLPEPDRNEAKHLLMEYLDARVKFAQSLNLEQDLVNNFLSNTKRIQGLLWDMAVANARKDMNSDVAALYIESLNQVIDIHALRVVFGLQARIPDGIWLVLCGITMLGMMGIGYQTGIAGSKRSMARPILALSFAMMIALIASLDNPENTFIRVSQQPLIDLRDSIRSAGHNTS